MIDKEFVCTVYLTWDHDGRKKYHLSEHTQGYSGGGNVPPGVTEIEYLNMDPHPYPMEELMTKKWTTWHIINGIALEL